MPWYWILIILSVIFGPFEALRAVNRARERRRQAENPLPKPTAESSGPVHSTASGDERSPS